MGEMIFFFYLIFINLVSGIIFSNDKQEAKKNRRRIPERNLHFMEVLGGVFVIFLLMYILRHKYRKFRYWVWTWLVLIGWVTLLIYLVGGF